MTIKDVIIKDLLIKYKNILRDKDFQSFDLDVELLICKVLKCDRVKLIVDYNREVSKEQFEEFNKLFKRRLKHEPMAYILGQKDFCGFNFVINKNVLIPRPITEELVDIIMKDVNNEETQHVASVQRNIIDIGTGSGCIIISLFKKLRKRLEFFEFYASDVSGKAILVAKENAERLGAMDNINFIKGNLKLPKGVKFDVIVANLPYVNKKSINFNNDNQKDLKFEPKVALFQGDKGFYLIKKLLNKTKKYLAEDGKIFLEIEKGQDFRIRKMFGDFYNVKSFFDGRIVRLEKSEIER